MVRRKAPLPDPVPGKPISRADLVAKYGADPKDLEAVEKVLTSFGLTVTDKNVAIRSLHVVGPASAMEQAFDVQLMRVKHADILYRGRVGEIHIPSELAGIITGVFGLDTRPMIKHRKPLNTQATHSTLPPPNQRPWYTPPELATAYHFPPGDGAGQTIAVLEFGGHYIPNDLKTFFNLIGLSADPHVNVKNVRPTLSLQERNDPDAIGETMLDIEIVASVCPKATITVYFSHWSEQGWINNLHAVLLDNPSVLSISYGLSEGNNIWTQQAIDAINDVLKELANAGITACVSSGDDGSDNQLPDGQAHVDFPAASPFVLAVGGTALSKSGEEVVWFDGDGLRRDGGGSTGSGVSEFNPRPDWQTIAIASVNPPHASNGRIVPDVAANAAGSTGYLLVASGSAQVSGGTSAATPLWAALIARLQQAGKVVGFLPPRLYQATTKTAGKPLGAVACKDITVGNNASGTAEGYSAAVGFDAVSGWGSPIGTALLEKFE
jgi:kumamolisin